MKWKCNEYENCVQDIVIVIWIIQSTLFKCEIFQANMLWVDVKGIYLFYFLNKWFSAKISSHVWVYDYSQVLKYFHVRFNEISWQ